MESQSAVKNKEIRQLIFRMLGIAIQKYKHGIGELNASMFSTLADRLAAVSGAVVKVIQLVQNFEHLVTPLAEAMQFFATSCGVKNIVSETIRSMITEETDRRTKESYNLLTFVERLVAWMPVICLVIQVVHDVLHYLCVNLEKESLYSFFQPSAPSCHTLMEK